MKNSYNIPVLIAGGVGFAALFTALMWLRYNYNTPSESSVNSGNLAVQGSTVTPNSNLEPRIENRTLIDSDSHENMAQQVDESATTVSPVILPPNSALASALPGENKMPVSPVTLPPNPAPASALPVVNKTTVSPVTLSPNSALTSALPGENKMPVSPVTLPPNSALTFTLPGRNEMPVSPVISIPTFTYKNILKPLRNNDDCKDFLEGEGYEFERGLGYGADGAVFKCKRDNRDVAVKIAGTGQAFTGNGVALMRPSIRDEINIINQLQSLKEEGKLNCAHLNIPKFVEAACADGGAAGKKSTYAIFESDLANSGDAETYFGSPILKKRRSQKKSMKVFDDVYSPDDEVDYAEIKNFAKQILEGLEVLHENHIYHRDMALRNILVHRCDDGTTNYSITDFDKCRYTTEVSDENNCKKWDVYEVGRMLISMWYNRLQMYNIGKSVSGIIELLKGSTAEHEGDMISMSKREYRINKYMRCLHYNGTNTMLQELSSAYYDEREWYDRENYTIKTIEKGSEVEKLLNFVKKLVADKPITAKQALEDEYFKEDAK